MLTINNIDRVYTQLKEKDYTLGYEYNKVMEQVKRDLYLLVA